MPIQPNAHPDRKTTQGEHSAIHHPPDADAPRKAFPDTGWDGPIPSADGGEEEADYMHKPPYHWESVGAKFAAKYTSACLCGNVEFEVHGDPLDAKHCHCRSCQKLHGAPFQWAVIFPKMSVRLVKNEGDSLHFFSTDIKTSESKHHVPCKVSCNTCRSPLFDEGCNTVLAYPSSFTFPDGKVPMDFQPTAHIFYAECVMEVPDGIPKWSGHKGSSTLMQELSNDEGKMPKYKGHVPEEEVQTGGAEAADESMEGEDEGEGSAEDEGIAGRVRKRART
ncbi:hypothetical protein HWV62_22277 [Athelia sp. TMB]|nr:hypothetical protein HWV62_22277 [Athelia sp. TMB]